MFCIVSSLVSLNDTFESDTLRILIRLSFHVCANGRFSYLCQRLYGLRVRVLRVEVNRRHLDDMYPIDEIGICAINILTFFNVGPIVKRFSRHAWSLEGEENVHFDRL